MSSYKDIVTRKKNIGLFILLTFFFTWIVAIPAALSSYGLANFKISKGLQTIATLSPGIVAIILTSVYEGKKGLKLFFKHLIKFKVSYKWYAFVLLAGLLISVISLVIFILFWKQNIKLDPVFTFLFYLLLFFFFSPLWEELGWRGYLLPKMLERFSFFKSSLIIGLVWGLWHLPIDLGFNPYGDKSIFFFLLVFIACFPMSIIQTWIYNSTNGNVFLCILFHTGVNASVAYSNANLIENEFRPLQISLVLFICLAAVICIKTKGTLISAKHEKIKFR